MSSEKLTAKLSDGTEWEFTTPPQETFDKSGWVAWLKPLKPSPPKEVFLCVYSDGSVSATYLTAEDASKYALGLSAPYPVHRYTLATEETAGEKNMRLAKEMFNADNAMLKALKKPAREWWEVRYRDDTNAVSSFSSKERAEGFMAHFGLALDSYEIVHVREVVSE